MVVKFSNPSNEDKAFREWTIPPPPELADAFISKFPPMLFKFSNPLNDVNALNEYEFIDDDEIDAFILKLLAIEFKFSNLQMILMSSVNDYLFPNFLQFGVIYLNL